MDNVSVYRVIQISTKHGDGQYDDEGSTYYDGWEERALPALYATKELAQVECDRLNGTVYKEFCDSFEEGPFVEITDDVSTALEDWNERVTLPWPQFCDWCADHDIPRPFIDIISQNDQFGPDKDLTTDELQDILKGDPPILSEMIDWWVEELPLLSKERRKQVEQLLEQVITGPKIYQVETHTVHGTEVSRMVSDLAAISAVGVAPSDDFYAAAQTLAAYVESVIKAGVSVNNTIHSALIAVNSYKG